VSHLVAQPNGNSGCSLVALDQLCEPIIGTRDPRNRENEPFVYIDISSVDTTRKQIVQPKQLVGRDASSRARQIVRENDVLVATTRPNLNAVALVPPELHEQIASTGFCVLRARDQLDPEYLFAFVQSPEFVRNLSALVKGALYPAVTDSQVRAQRVLLQPLDEQRRVAARLREQFSILEEARAALETQLKAAEALHAANLRAVFESEEAKRWPLKRLGNLLSLRQEIVHPRNKPIGTARFVGLEHIEPHTGQRISELLIQMEQLTGRKARFFSGDIVYGYLRPYLNKVWIADFDGLCSVDQYVFEVHRNLVETNFVAWFLRSSTYLARAPISQTPGWLPRIRTDEVAAVQINLPPLDEQREIASRLNAEFSAGKELSESIRGKLSELEKLPAALLRTAFGQ
jgi:type I restriction enzyme S subunit